mmetsp:Transcript_16926/g.36625  ORF Transcript_16926/g.36625 Transcript_16926/m.36625 type:complete len:83 (-) Transcript_16926:1592-1840(-)
MWAGNASKWWTCHYCALQPRPGSGMPALVLLPPLDSTVVLQDCPWAVLQCCKYRAWPDNKATTHSGTTLLHVCPCGNPTRDA